MGEETKQEEVKVEEKTEEKKEEPKPPSPVILFVDLHCVGCAKKIERSIMKFRGVEEVMIDTTQNQVTVKGIVDPQAICMIIQKKTKRKANILSPLPAAKGEPTPQVVASEALSGLTTVELNVNMHCEGCALQLKRKILKMRGVQTVETDMSSGKVMVTGIMDANRLVNYVYRRTKKQARIVSQPKPEPEKPEEKKEGEKPAEEATKPEEKKQENTQKEENAPKEEKKENNNDESKDKEEKSDESKEEPKKEGEEIINEELMKMMMYYHNKPLYVMERIPPPQLFSEENPNACCIS